MDQQTFLRLAKRELGVSYPQLAGEIGVSARTMEKWSLTDKSADHRQMPLMARKFIARLLEEKKYAQVLAGDRATAEVVDAIASHVNRDSYHEALLTFDSLQRSANRLVRLRVYHDRPCYFRNWSEKNAWSEEEEIRNARKASQRITQKSAAAR